MRTDEHIQRICAAHRHAASPRTVCERTGRRDAASSGAAPAAAGGVRRRTEDARAAAYRRFGNPTLVRERSYTSWGWSWLEGLLQDMLYGLRAMLRSPGITIVALLSLALGIGANTAIFSLMDAVMLRSLPVKNPQQLLLLGTGDMGHHQSFGSTDLYSYPFIASCRTEPGLLRDGRHLQHAQRRHGFVAGRKT